MIRQAFFRAAANDNQTGSMDFLQAILQERIDLKGLPAYFPEQGWFAHTVIIGSEVFKGSQLPFHAGDIDKECQSLQLLEGKGLPVPRVTYVGQRAFFYGMNRMQGSALPKDFLKILTQQEQVTLVRDIVDFIIALACALPPNEKGEYMAHRDLHPGNILIDPKTKKLAGVVDFGLMKYTPKELLARCGADPGELTKMVVREYKSRQWQHPVVSTVSDIKPSLPRR